MKMLNLSPRPRNETSGPFCRVSEHQVKHWRHINIAISINFSFQNLFSFFFLTDFPPQRKEPCGSENVGMSIILPFLVAVYTPPLGKSADHSSLLLDMALPGTFNPQIKCLSSHQLALQYSSVSSRYLPHLLRVQQINSLEILRVF